MRVQFVLHDLCNVSSEANSFKLVLRINTIILIIYQNKSIWHLQKVLILLNTSTVIAVI